MPFDPLDYRPPEPGIPRSPKRGEDLVLAAIVLFAFAMLLLPIGGGTLVQLVIYLFR